ncbi:hypothetical protein [Aromatoleum diolicum]|uniref:DUF1269 domain-containing protein n=1 Tax=Aromatoleum diolicum TaxID=75796 RepID=A0ABX1Q7H9_9RHOO|nr:hypothetical protein [Aromatoleum diolicum]NMG74025.1 hypothetical protein [Aromatoleum diolicum]
MDDYRHHVSGFFAHRDQAQLAFSRLVEQGLPRERLHLFEKNDLGSPDSAAAPEAGSKEVLKDVLVDGAIGTAVGTGVGALAQLALVAANVSLFVASPLIAPLAMLGWGASLGGLIGAAAGAGTKEKTFEALVRDAIASGQFVLVAETRTEQETAIAREIIQTLVGEYNDVSKE